MSISEPPQVAAGPAVADGSDPVLFPILGGTALEELADFGRERAVAAGERLFSAGDEAHNFFVILAGEVEVVLQDASGKTLSVIATHRPGNFAGELNLLTGQRAFLTARVTQAGRVLEIGPEEFRRMMSTKPELADLIFAALVARRGALTSNQAALAIRIVGSRYSPEAMALRGFAERSRLAYTWIDLEDDPGVQALLHSIGVRPVDTPVVITPTGVLRRPSPGAFAEELGLTYHPVPGRVFDLVVVGTGPCGLAASVYGASEGLRTLSLDAAGPGGQAGASSRIENYVGFPMGISGGDLTEAAARQAVRLGAQLVSPCQATGLRSEAAFHVVVLNDGSEIPCRSVIVATGARYQRLAIDNLSRFEGAGVYYAATDLEARVCAGDPVVVVGGGNSAGQAAIYLAQQGCDVSIAIRRDDLAANMSQYLIARIEAHDRIQVLTGTEVRELIGDTHLRQVTLETTRSGQRRTVDCSGLFCFIGADPATGWLGDTVALDESGFILTDRSLPTGVAPPEVLRDPLPFETSAPGVFAAGDVRSGSLKRVAAAVGEGSSAVRSVHEYLAATAP